MLLIFIVFLLNIVSRLFNGEVLVYEFYEYFDTFVFKFLLYGELKHMIFLRVFPKILYLLGLFHNVLVSRKMVSLEKLSD